MAPGESLKGKCRTVGLWRTLRPICLLLCVPRRVHARQVQPFIQTALQMEPLNATPAQGPETSQQAHVQRAVLRGLPAACGAVRLASRHGCCACGRQGRHGQLRRAVRALRCHAVRSPSSRLSQAPDHLRRCCAVVCQDSWGPTPQERSKGTKPDERRGPPLLLARLPGALFWRKPVAGLGDLPCQTCCFDQPICQVLRCGRRRARRATRAIAANCLQTPTPRRAAAAVLADASGRPGQAVLRSTACTPLGQASILHDSTRTLLSVGDPHSTPVLSKRPCGSRASALEQ